MKILLGFVGLQVDKLIRTDFGAYTLGNLGPGEFREVRAISKERVGRIRPFEDCFVWCVCLRDNLSAGIVTIIIVIHVFLFCIM